MKKIISVLMVLGFVWMVAAPSLAGQEQQERQEQEKEFKSVLDDVRDPKEAWAMVVGSWNTAIVLFSGYCEKLMEYEFTPKLKQKLDDWKAEERFTQMDEDRTNFMLGAMYHHLTITNNLLFEGKAAIPIQSLDDLVAINGPLHKNFKGTVEDVRKAEKALFWTINITNKLHDSPILELIRKDKEKEQKEEK